MDQPQDKAHGDPMRDATDARASTIDRWEDNGWPGTFRILAGGRLRCSQCGREHEPEAVQVDRMGRHEGISDPEDEELLLAMTCTACGHRGTVTLAYGAYASADEAEAARRLVDARPQHS